jgi:SAM-dependent methyltransferase
MKRLPFWRRPYFARLILDIGAGHNPFKNATHVVEIDPTQGRQRGGNSLVVPESAKLIAGDVTALPFRSGSFDYVYASHVLEHVEDPERACQEIMRVGTAGYIETPSPLLEQGLALHDEQSDEHWFHKWFVFLVGKDLLVFEPKTRKEVSRFCSCSDGQFLREFLACVDFREAQHCLRRKAKTTITYWTTSFRVEVRNRAMDCEQDGRECRFIEMRRALLANCNDLLRARRVLRLRAKYPECRNVIQKYRHMTLLIQ